MHAPVLAVLLLASVVTAGCASPGSDERLGDTCDYDRMQAVQKASRPSNTSILWVNCPQKRDRPLA